MPTRIGLRRLKVLAWTASLAPALLFGAYAWTSYRQAFADAETKAVRFTAVVHEHALRVFEAIELALTLADQRLGTKDWQTIRTSPTLWQEIRDIQRTGPQIGSIFVLAPDGSNPLTTRQFPASSVDFSDRDYFLAQREKDAGLFLGAPYVGKISKGAIFNFSIRRTSAAGFDGVVGSSADVEYFRNFYAKLGDPSDNFAVSLLHENGDILARYPDFRVGQTFDVGRLDPPASAHAVARYGVSPADGLERVYALEKVDRFPAYAGYSIARASILAKWWQGLIAPGILALAFTIALLALTRAVLRGARAQNAAMARLAETAVSLESEIEGRRRAEASLMQSQRLDAIGQMTGGIAHDFNNLLTIVIGNLDLAQRRSDPATVQRLLATARHAAGRGARLVAQLLAFSRVQELKPEVVDLNAVLRESVALVKRAVGDGIDIIFDLAADPWPTCIDVAQFEIALLNLAVNARDAMQGRGTLTLATENLADATGEAVSGPLQPGDYVQVSVTDTGAGMPAEVAARAYEPFFTTKEVGKGSGMGLAQVHGFCGQSGGGMSIASEPGRGTTIALLLPRSLMPAAAPAKLAAPPLSPAGQVECSPILVVEDDDAVRAVTMMMAEELGYTCIGVRSGPEALALLAAGGRFDAVFTDVVMASGMNGIELASEIARRWPDLPVLLTSAAPSANWPYAVLQKPFAKADLATALYTLMERRQQDVAAEQG